MIDADLIHHFDCAGVELARARAISWERDEKASIVEILATVKRDPGEGIAALLTSIKRSERYAGSLENVEASVRRGAARQEGVLRDCGGALQCRVGKQRT